jgi:hypothetical protein
MKIILTIWTLLLTVYAQADHHAEAAPVETWNCSLNEGKTINDVRKISKAVGAWTKAQGQKDAQWIFTPFTGDTSDPGRFILMTGWSDFSGMGDAFQSFFSSGDEKAAAIFAEWTATATCNSRNLWTVESTYNLMQD